MKRPDTGGSHTLAAWERRDPTIAAPCAPIPEPDPAPAPAPDPIPAPARPAEPEPEV